MKTFSNHPAGGAKLIVGKMFTALCLATVTLFLVGCSPEAQLNRGKNYYKDGKYTDAVKWFRKAAESGLAEAQFNLGICYYNGQGIAQNYAEAIGWFRKAAEQGIASAQFNLGNCYYYGQGVKQDFGEAIKWFRKAADQEDAEAQMALGRCYLEGTGLAKDPAQATRCMEQAVKWHRKVAEEGKAESQYRLAICYERGIGIAKNSAEAMRWYRKAAEQGYAPAQYQLGLIYQYGRRCNEFQNLEGAVKWYRKAAEQGHANAQNKLGDCYKRGAGTAKDLKEAIKWYRKAAEQGCADAELALGVCYRDGQGVAKDLKEAAKRLRKAVSWYREAAEGGNLDAQNKLIECYMKGEGVAKDFAEAMKWFKKRWASKANGVELSEIMFFASRGYVAGTYLAGVAPGKKILIIVDPAFGKGPADAGTIEMLKIGYGCQDVAIAAISVRGYSPEDCLEEVMKAKDFDKLTDHYKDSGIIISLIGLPSDAHAMKAFSANPAPKFFLLGTGIGVGKFVHEQINKGGIIGAALPNPKANYDLKAPTDPAQAFAIRFVLVTKDNFTSYKYFFE